MGSMPDVRINFDGFKSFCGGEPTLSIHLNRSPLVDNAGITIGGQEDSISVEILEETYNYNKVTRLKKDDNWIEIVIYLKSCRLAENYDS